MKKVFYSDILNKYFNSEEECIREELAEQKRRSSIKQQNETLFKEEADSRKKAAKAVEDADAAVWEAYSELKKAEESARKEYEKIVAPVKKKLKDAEKARYESIQNFNKKYGVYTKRYTGKDAYDEFLRSIDRIEDMWNIFNI